MCSLTSKFRLIANSFNKLTSLSAIPIRHSSYKGSEFVEDLADHKVKYEVTKNPVEWKYVERLFAPTLIPDPIPKAQYPSQWKPQAQDLKDRPYFVARTKNHMIPVYLQTTYRNSRKLTYVRKIQGDIWLLEKEVREFLQREQLKPIRSQVNEFVGYVCFHGDHVNAIKYWLMQRNF